MSTCSFSDSVGTEQRGARCGHPVTAAPAAPAAAPQSHTRTCASSASRAPACMGSTALHARHAGTSPGNLARKPGLHKRTPRVCREAYNSPDTLLHGLASRLGWGNVRVFSAPAWRSSRSPRPPQSPRTRPRPPRRRRAARCPGTPAPRPALPPCAAAGVRLAQGSVQCAQGLTQGCTLFVEVPELSA